MLLRCVVTHIQVTNQWLSVLVSSDAEASISVMMILDRIIDLSSSHLFGMIFKTSDSNKDER